MRGAENQRRRAKDGIVSAIAETDDTKLKVVLMLLLQVVEEVGDKIDEVLDDEKGLRESVLNGYAQVHHKHHEWIEQRMASDCDVGCEWAVKEMRAEEQDTKDAIEQAKADRRAARDTVIRQGITILMSVALGAVGAMWAVK